MTDTEPVPLVAGNWKMNGLKTNLGEVEELIVRLRQDAPSCEVLICPPYTLVRPMAAMVDSTAINLGAQDCHPEAAGAHTGDISAEMLADAGCRYVIVGHSERRSDYQESNDLIRSKAEASIRAGLTAIICIGETEAQRDDGAARDVVTGQLRGSIPEKASPHNTVIAYEPVWAIGTGRTPTIEDVGEMHEAIRRELRDPGFRVLYGGSVKPSNAAELMAVDNVDGALVGGASLKAADFDGIISVYR